MVEFHWDNNFLKYFNIRSLDSVFLNEYYQTYLYTDIKNGLKLKVI